jgi:hypothetical protein
MKLILTIVVCIILLSIFKNGSSQCNLTKNSEGNSAIALIQKKMPRGKISRILEPKDTIEKIIFFYCLCFHENFSCVAKLPITNATYYDESKSFAALEKTVKSKFNFRDVKEIESRQKGIYLRY